MLSIRLSRIGKRKKPMYRLVISEKTKDPYGNSLEILGSYNPFTKELVAKNDRIEHWIKMGAQMTPTVNNLLLDKKVIKGKKIKASKPGKPQETPAEEKKEEKTAEEKKEEKPVEEAKTEKKTEEKPAE